ncbi:MAG: xanthine dehydrogenase family protein subunit M, partial [Pseudonocardiaceae bacterium]|nr:xanthine dehydrogenase family protein subunit M [Pseudonocardiaceae bacterium]
KRAPLLVEALGWVGSPAIRNRGTVGGSLAHADPAAELPAVAVALDCEVEARSSRGERRIPARELFAAPMVSALQPDEVLTHLRIPTQPPGAGHAWHEWARRHADRPVVGVAVSLIVAADGLTARALAQAWTRAQHQTQNGKQVQ